MKNLILISLMAVLAGCSAAPEKIQANKEQVKRDTAQCLKQQGLPVLAGQSKRAKQKVICADKHMMSTWQSQSANCARKGGTPNMYGTYRGVYGVVFSDCHMPYEHKAIVQ